MISTATALALNAFIARGRAISILTGVTSLWLSLHKTFPGWNGDQTTGQATYPQYARNELVRADDETGELICTSNYFTLAADAQFPKMTSAGDAEDYYFAALGTAQNGAGNVLLIGGLGGIVRPCSFATDGTIAWNGHGCGANDPVVFLNGPSETSLGGGVTEGQVYYVIASGLTANALKVSATKGGAAVTITSLGHGFAQRMVPLHVQEGTTPIIEAANTRFYLG